MASNKEINRALLGLRRRAEVVERDKLVRTFVDIGPLAAMLGSEDHQIVYGRRGTGKTHALIYLASERAKKGDLAIYIDLRNIGSTGGLYADPGTPLAERATRLLADVLCTLHDELLDVFYHREDVDLGPLGADLDAFAEAITEVVVKGHVTTERERETSRSQEHTAAAGVKLSMDGVAIEASGSNQVAEAGRHRSLSTTAGEPEHRVHFGAVAAALRRITANLSDARLWILLDEWSVVPADLQPYLADLVRRALLPTPRITVKIGAIEHRSSFLLHGPQGTYVGIEPGADAAADLNLDDFMVFDNDAEKATRFFEHLLFRHFKTIAAEQELPDPPTSSQEFIRAAFTQKTPFEELVTAAEGVPRDALNILILAAQRADERALAINHVRSAAKSWYQRDKEAAVAANPEAKRLLHWIIDKVIAHRRARAFLLRSGTRHPIVDALFDARVLHMAKRSISAHDEPGVRYDAYKIDYGCYVDLLTTGQRPLGLFELDDENKDGSHIDVPPDDYRAIRRAILHLEEFEAERAGGAG